VAHFSRPLRGVGPFHGETRCLRVFVLRATDFLFANVLGFV
jgi:hypothetical protein